VFWADSSFHSLRLVSSPAARTGDVGESFLLDSLRSRRPQIERLVRYTAAEYRKIEPLFVGTPSNPRTTLVFIVGGPETAWKVVGLVLDDRRFVSDVLAPKVSEAATEEFHVGVFRSGEETPLFGTGVMRRGDVAQSKDLWVFPNVLLGISFRGESLDTILRARFVRNLILILLLDAVLLVGVWLAYRGLTKQIELVRMKSDFVSTVSHELRTPLSLIRMYAETLEMGRLRDPERQKEYHTTILRETERLTRLVNTILSFSRMESGKKRFRMEETDLNTVVGGVMDTYASHLEANGFSPAVELGAGLPHISVDREAVAESLINIVDNAVKYSPGEKYLQIRTGEDTRGVFVEVEDHGVGISRQEQDKVFEAFYRVSEGLVHTTRGTGLGLTLVKGIMDAHGGKIVLETTPGQGSRFRLIFPRTSREISAKQRL
jgi:two-component system phosphate regulon sensor histidine kinase PhoR